MLAQDKDDLYVKGHYQTYPHYLQVVQTIYSYRSYWVVPSIVVATRLAQCGLGSFNINLLHENVNLWHACNQTRLHIDGPTSITCHNPVIKRKNSLFKQNQVRCFHSHSPPHIQSSFAWGFSFCSHFEAIN